MGSLAHGLDLARPLAVHGVRLRAGDRQQARPHAGGGFRACRSAGARRRARRRSRSDASDRQPQRDREDGRGHRARSDRAREPAAVIRPLATLRGRPAVRFVEPDQRGARHHRAAVGHRRAGPRRADRRSGGGKLPLFRPHRVHRAGRRRRRHRRPRRNLAQRLYRLGGAPPRRYPRRNRATGLELHHPPHRPAGE